MFSPIFARVPGGRLPYPLLPASQHPQCARQSLADYRLDKAQEVFVTRNEVGFTVHFNHRSEATVIGGLYRNDPISRGAASFLRGLHSAGLAQRLNRRIDIAIRFRERFLALQKAQAGRSRSSFTSAADMIFLAIPHSSGNTVDE